MLHKTTQSVGIVAVLVFLISGTLFGGIAYIVSGKEVALENAMQEIANTSAYERQLSSLTRIAEESKEERNELEKFILREEEVIDFLSMVETIGQEQRIELNTRSLNVVSTSGPFEQLVVGIQVTGPYDALLHVIKILEHLPYQVSMSGLSLSNISSNAENDKWVATFDILVTKYKES